MNNQTEQTATRHRCRTSSSTDAAAARHRSATRSSATTTTRTPVANPRARAARRSTLQLPLPEDRASIQLSIGRILERLASNDLDPRRAGLLLYGLQIASSNLPPHQQLPSHARPLPEQPLEEVVLDPGYGLLAPPAEALKTRSEMWDDISRERRFLSDQEKNLREREAALKQERVAIEREKILHDERHRKDTPASPEAIVPQPAAPSAIPIPPSCFASPERHAQHEAELRAYRESLVLSSVKAQATPLQQRRSANRRRKSDHLQEATDPRHHLRDSSFTRRTHRMRACPASICSAFSPYVSLRSRPKIYRQYRHRRRPLHGRRSSGSAMMPSSKRTGQERTFRCSDSC